MKDHAFSQAMDVLRHGGTVAFPTDTVYGLGCDGLNTAAVRRVFTVKQRPLTMALPLLVSDLDMFRASVASLPDTAVELINAFMPGPLTLVLRKANGIPDEVTARGNTVAVRIPDHDIPRELAKHLGGPVIGTSANRSGLPSPVTADEVRIQLGTGVDCIIDGVCTRGLESTIVDLSGKAPVILRQGVLSAKSIEQVLGKTIPVR